MGAIVQTIMGETRSQLIKESSLFAEDSAFSICLGKYEIPVVFIIFTGIHSIEASALRR